MMVKPTSDLLAHDGGFSFNLGCADPELRRIASWMLTNSNNRRKLAKIIPALWKRHGYEDLKMVGILLSNLSEDDLGEETWMAFIHLLQKRESLDIILDCFSLSLIKSVLTFSNLPLDIIATPL